MRLTNSLWIVTLLSLMFGQGQCFVLWMLSPSSKSLLYATDTTGNDEADKEKGESPSSDLIRPLAGGPSLIFAMAQRLNLWDDILNDSSENLSSSTNKASAYSASLPRFRQSSQGISNVNPNFRTSSPIMNKKGYASSIIRNARKKNKPGLWRYSLRTYQKLKGIELMNTSGGKDTVNDGISETDNEVKLKPAEHRITATNSSSSTYSGNNKSSLMIYRENEHFQGVLVAVAKLGLWQEALNIYNELQELIVLKQACKSNESRVGSTPVKRRKDLKINSSMVFSVIDACVRGMKLR
jgi:hypothetical protein